MRISVTTLDRFREYLEEPDEEKSETILAGLRRYITNPPPPTAAMRRGTAIHHVCEHPYIVPTMAASESLITEDGFQFTAGDLRQIIRALPKTRSNEEPFTSTMFGNDFPEKITVSGRVDAIDFNAMVGYDIKTRWRKSGVSAYDEQQDFDRLQDSAQWKFYSVVNGLERFRYVVVNFTDTNPATLLTIQTVECQPYGAAMAAELDNLVYAFAEWITNSDLQQYFKDK